MTSKEKTMDIPMKAKVYCQEKLYGHTQAVIINPVSDVVTHVVVQESQAPHTQRLVPITMIDASVADKILLKCDNKALQDLPPFAELEYIRASIPRYMEAFDMFYMEPIVVPETKITTGKHYRIPKNELAINRGTSVYSADGDIVGKVDEFLVDQDDGQVTHLILREGHLWGQKDVIIPVEEIDKFKESRLRLKLNKEEIGNLPTIPVNRIWQ
jgi:sporulation protein YlmC with PRC-barrel domain